MHMNLLRPINIVAGERPLSIFESVGQKEEDQKVRCLILFCFTFCPSFVSRLWYSCGGGLLGLGL